MSADAPDLEDRLPVGGDRRTSISPTETWWRDHYDWLLSLGFQLRPRYRPDWVPSWKATGGLPYWCEDHLRVLKSNLMDAQYEGRVVVLKRISEATHPDEINITTLLCTEPLISDPENRCVPVIRILQVPEDDDLKILVMPMLRRALNPPLRTVGEAMQCIREIFEGIEFMHKHNVAHRDCAEPNLMLDPSSMYPEGFHFVEQNRNVAFTGPAVHYSRTERRTKYHIIDFGLSKAVTADSPKARRVWAADKTPPEFQDQPDDALYDPFPTDVYYLGNWLRVHMMDGDLAGPSRAVLGMYGLEFLRPLVQEMVQDDPSKRPKMDEVVSRLKQIELGLSVWRLRSRVIQKKTYNPLTSWFYMLKHWFWTVKLIFRRVPAIPPPLTSVPV